MTHNDIYTKFMIEYDKANVTSSYPSLTKYEVATILDKAYLTLIARKLTGNNTRRVPFEYDTKAVEDLRPLLTSSNYYPSQDKKNILSDNEFVYDIPSDMLYYIGGHLNYFVGTLTPADNTPHRKQVVKSIPHMLADRFRSTATNMPWIPEPVSFMEEDGVHVLLDPYKIFQIGYNEYDLPQLAITYIKTPAKFANPVWPTEDQSNSGNQGQGGSGNQGGSGPGSGSQGGGQQAEGMWEGIPTGRIYNENNTFQFNIVYTRGTFSTTNIKYSLNAESLNEYVSITEDGLLTIKPTAVNGVPITIKASTVSDFTTFVVLCKYSVPEQQPGESYIRIEKTGENDTHVFVTVYVTAGQDCYLGILKLKSQTDPKPAVLKYNGESVYGIEEGSSNWTITLSIPRQDSDYYVRGAIYTEQQLTNSIASSGENIIKINKLETTPSVDPQQPDNQQQPVLGTTFVIGESKLGKTVVIIYNAPRRT